MEKVKINLEILLPNVPDERDACVERILSLMQKHKGIEKAHITGDGAEAQLCFHYNPDVITLQDVETAAKHAGAAITEQFGHMLVEIKAFREISEAEAVQNEIKKLKGVLNASVSGTGVISVEYDQSLTNKKEIFQVLQKNNLEIIANKDLATSKQGSQQQTGKFKGENHKHRPGQDHDHKDEDNHEHDEISSEDDMDDEHGHDHGNSSGSSWKTYAPVGVSLVMLLIGIVLDQFYPLPVFSGWVRFGWYAVAYLPVGFPVAKQGVTLLLRGDVFTEFVLMTIATVGAFFIGEYPEGVAVMVFYTVGELFQDAAVNRAKRSIKALLDIRPASAFVKRDDRFVEVAPNEVKIDEIIQIKAGDKVPLDGEMLNGQGTFNTAALTGESKPSEISKGESVLAGMINQDKAVELKVTKLYNDSSLARILTMVQQATTRKAKTEQFIRKFSRIYTPIVVFIAIGIATLPYFFVEDYMFKMWLYRALIFLVISCPCALVISIPLGYFGGIGAASRNGILFKGSNFLDLMTKVNTVVMDKTGTLTKGVFKVQDIKSYGVQEDKWLPIAAALEAASTHPVAQAVVQHVGEAAQKVKVNNLQEVGGHGIKGEVNGQQVLVGNLKLMDKEGITYSEEIKGVEDTIVIVAMDKKVVGYVTIADEIKLDSEQAVKALHEDKIETVMLSGDKQAVVNKVAAKLGIDKAFGDLLPEHKVQKMEEIKKDKSKVVAFVGDGINDSPVLALSDVGMAMGGLGSDAAIETADVIIQTDQPSKISSAIAIGRATNKIVWQNIIFAFVVKAIVMALGATGKATMWEAVFADVGVALLAVFNAMRIQKMDFK